MPTTVGNGSGSHIVVMPFPGRGHINPMINFCTLLASKHVNLLITFVLTEEWVELIGSQSLLPNIRLRSIANVIPSEHNRAANYAAFIEAVYNKMETPFDQFLDYQLQKLPVTCIVSDLFLPWITSLGIRRNIPVALLSPMVPSIYAIFHHFDLLTARGHFQEGQSESEKREEIIDYVPGVSPMHSTDLTTTGPGLQYTLQGFSASAKAQAILFTSFYELQPQSIDILRVNLSIPLYSIGPSIPFMSLQAPPSPDGRLPPYFKWLHSQPQSSVLYVSLGSFLSTSGEQMLEISAGLQASGVKYLWVARGETGLSESFGVQMGMVVPWCDQLRVLCHSAVGGFLTHCGWNSTMESIFAGVPMLTFPLGMDQTYNSKLVVEDWKIGLKLRAGGVGEDVKNVVGRERIAEKVKTLMDLNGEEGKELRCKAKELQESCLEAIKMGGSTDTNIAAFARDFLRTQS